MNRTLHDDHGVPRLELDVRIPLKIELLDIVQLIGSKTLGLGIIPYLNSIESILTPLREIDTLDWGSENEIPRKTRGPATSHEVGGSSLCKPIDGRVVSNIAPINVHLDLNVGLRLQKREEKNTKSLMPPLHKSKGAVVIRGTGPNPHPIELKKNLDDLGHEDRPAIREEMARHSIVSNDDTNQQPSDVLRCGRFTGHFGQDRPAKAAGEAADLDLATIRTLESCIIVICGSTIERPFPEGDEV